MAALSKVFAWKLPLRILSEFKVTQWMLSVWKVFVLIPVCKESVWIMWSYVMLVRNLSVWYEAVLITLLWKVWAISVYLMFVWKVIISVPVMCV